MIILLPRRGAKFSFMFVLITLVERWVMKGVLKALFILANIDECKERTIFLRVDYHYDNIWGGYDYHCSNDDL
jgi:hypothetical protein